MPNTRTEHTPEGWTVTHNSWEMSTVYGPYGEIVAECPIDACVTEENQHEFEPIKEGNARLIAGVLPMAAAVMEVLKAVREHLPPDGISKEDLIDRVIGAIDNAEINPVIEVLETTYIGRSA